LHKLFLTAAWLIVLSWGVSSRAHGQTAAADPVDFEFAIKTKYTTGTPRYIAIHPFILCAPNQVTPSNWFAGATVQYGRHEAGGSYHLELDQDGPGGSVHYRYHLVRNQWQCQPYAGVYAITRPINFTSLAGFDNRGAYTEGGLSLGVNLAVAPGVSLFLENGVGARQIRESFSGIHWRGLYGTAMAGVRGTLRVRGEKLERGWQRAPEFSGDRRLSLQVMGSVRPDLWFNRFTKPNSHVSVGVEVRATQLLRPYAHVAFGGQGQLWDAYMNDSLPKAFAFRHVQAGMRFYTAIFPRWALFQDAGIAFNTRYGTYPPATFSVGQGVSVRVCKAVYLNGMLRFNMNGREEYGEAAVGVGFNPF
jgi:hypothetical protein